MPPHDCLGRQFYRSLVSQARQTPRQNEPLLFLYPPWFRYAASPAQRRVRAVSTLTPTSVAADDSDVDRRRSLAKSQLVGTVAPSSNHEESGGSQQEQTIPTNEDPGRMLQRYIPLQPSQNASENPDTPVTGKLVNRVVQKNRYVQVKRAKKYQYAQARMTGPGHHPDRASNWREAFALLRRHTPAGPNEHINRHERLEMPKDMVGFYAEDDINILFLEIYLVTDCHVQLATDDLTENNTKDAFRALTLSGSSQAIRAAKARLNDTISVKPADSITSNDSKPSKRLGAHRAKGGPLLRPYTLRTVYAHDYNRQHLHKAVHEIPVPTLWTIISFANYVADLTNSNPPRLYARKAYADSDASIKRSHVAAVTNALVDLFSNPWSAECFSNFATERAFTFLLQHRQIGAVRHLMAVLDSAYKKSTHPDGALTTLVFNSCLKAAGEAWDVPNYTFLVKVMLSRDCVPNWATWVSLFRMAYHLEPEKAKSLMMPAMRQKGLLANISAQMDIAGVLVYSGFTDWVDKGLTTSAFIAMYDKQFGTQSWLDPFVTANMVKVRAMRGQFTDAISIVNTLVERGRFPEVVTLTTLLEEAARQNNPRAVLASLRALMPEGESNSVQWRKIVILERVYEKLFEMGLSRGDYNLLRVVWRYACLAGRVSKDLDNMMRQWTRTYMPESDTPPHKLRLEIARQFGAKAALGIEEPRPDFGAAHHVSMLPRSPEMAQPEQLENDFGNQIAACAYARDPRTLPAATSSDADEKTSPSDPVEPDKLRKESLDSTPALDTPALETYRPVHSFRDELEEAYKLRREFLTTTLELDMEAWEMYRPVHSFTDKLEEAIALDASWDHLGIKKKVRNKKVSFRWVLDHMVQVPVERLEQESAVSWRRVRV